MDISAPDRTAHWLERLAQRPVPVLRETHTLLAQASENPDRADANSLADVILRDPLMTLRVLGHVSQQMGSRLATPVETITAGLVLLGIEPFFRYVADLPVIEDQLAREPEALAGVLLAIRRSHRAAGMAAAIAIYRQDEDAEVQHQAALLDNFAGLLVWCEAPRLALEMAARQHADASLRSTDVQRQVLGVALAQLELALMQRWKLPGFVCNMTDAAQWGQAGAVSVKLAVRIARHSQEGWDNPALPDDYVALGRLLNMPPMAAAQVVQGLDG